MTTNTATRMRYVIFVFAGYWPKLVSGLWFCVFNLILLYRYTGIKKFSPSVVDAFAANFDEIVTIKNTYLDD